MDKEQIEQFRRKLEISGKEIEEEIKKLQKITDFGDDIDPDEETKESEQFGNQLAMAQQLKARLSDIDSALNKIGKNSYGKCEKCGSEISLDILEIVPESRLCRDCKKSLK